MIRLCLLFLGFTQTTDGGSHGGGGGGGVHPSATGDGPLAALAGPDAHNGALHGVLAAEGASVLAVLGDFHLLDHLTQGGTITGTIFTNDSNLLGALGHFAVVVGVLDTGKIRQQYSVHVEMR